MGWRRLVELPSCQSRRLRAFAKLNNALGCALSSILLLPLLTLFVTPAYGSIAADTTVAKDSSAASNTITTPAFSTTSANELLLAFVATDYTVKSIAGGGLTWALVKRVNAQSGTAEIWRALAIGPLSSVTVSATLSQSVASSITVMSFSGVSTSGTNGSGAIGAIGGASAASGAPTATLLRIGAGSWVLGVGDDFDNATSRTVGGGQTLVHQYLTAIGDTYWVQRPSAPVANAGTSVTINDTAPTKDRYNLSIVEVVAATGTVPTYSISGTISPASLGAGASVSLNGASTASTTADASGSYTFAGLATAPTP
jgi:hypothetical protein